MTYRANVRAPLIQDAAAADNTLYISPDLASLFQGFDFLVLDPGVGSYEKVTLDAVNASAGELTVTRGVNGTTAKHHSSGGTVIRPVVGGGQSEYLDTYGGIPDYPPLANAYGAVAVGVASTAASAYSYAGGHYGYANGQGVAARGASEPTYGKAAQQVSMPFQAYTADGNATYADQGLPVGANAGSALTFRGTLTAVSKSGYTAGWEFTGVAYNHSGSAAMAGYTMTKLQYTGAGGALGDNMAATLAVYNGAVYAKVTGAASEYIQWAGEITGAQVYGSA